MNKNFITSFLKAGQVLLFLVFVFIIPGNLKAIKNTRDVSSLEEALKLKVPVVLKIGSDKCFPCRRMNPIMKELAVEQNGQTVFLSIDVYKNLDLAKKIGVRLIPTIVLFDKNGQLKAKYEGALGKEEILKIIKDLGLNK